MAVIKVQPWGEGQGDHVLIEEKDFNKDLHKPYVEDVPELTKKVDNVDDGKVLSKNDKKFNALIVKLDVLKDKEIEFCANHLGFEFTTKDETVAKIKEFLEQK